MSLAALATAGLPGQTQRDADRRTEQLVDRLTHGRLAIALPDGKDHLELARRRRREIRQHLNLLRLEQLAVARAREDAERTDHLARPRRRAVDRNLRRAQRILALHVDAYPDWHTGVASEESFRACSVRSIMISIAHKMG